MKTYNYKRFKDENIIDYYTRCNHLISENKVTFNNKKEWFINPENIILNDINYYGIIRLDGEILGLEEIIIEEV